MPVISKKGVLILAATELIFSHVVTQECLVIAEQFLQSINAFFLFLVIHEGKIIILK